MQDLIKTIITIRKKIKIHRTNLSKNETMTRYALIDPLLRDLGWDLSDPDCIVPEDRTRAGSITDYTTERDAMIIEAKKLDENLDKYTDKLTEYVRDKGVRYGVLTNGRKWKIYDAQTMKSPKIEFDITDSDSIVIPKTMRLHRLVVLDSIQQQPSIGEKKAVDKIDEGQTATSTKSGGQTATSTKSGGQTATSTKSGFEMDLPTFESQYTRNMILPNELVCPDKRVPLTYWIDILIGVADWLIDKGRITKLNCPVPIGQYNAILNTVPVNQNGRSFPTYKKIGNLFLNKQVNPSSVIKYSIKIITIADSMPSDFKVYFRNSNHPDPRLS